MRKLIAMAVMLAVSAGAASAEPKKHRLFDWKLITVLAVQFAAANADAYTTNRCLHRFPGCVETNGLLGRRPSSHRVYLSTNGVMAAFAVAEIYLKKHGDNAGRYTWTLGAAVTTPVSIWSTVHNIHVYERMDALTRNVVNLCGSTVANPGRCIP